MSEEAEAVDALLRDGDHQGAFEHLRMSFGWPGGRALPPGELPRWLGLLAEIAAKKDAPGLAELAGEAVRDPDSPDRLYDLGYALIDAGAPEVAACVLWRCLALVGESEEVVCELVSALESALAYPDALAILGAHPALRARSFLCRYLYAFDAAMSGRLELVRECAPRLAPETDEHRAMTERIEALVERANTLVGRTANVAAKDLRGWHYVLSGGLLLHQSPYGFDEPMHGRYAWLADSLPRIAWGLERLATLVAPLQLPCIYAPPGRGNEIVARAAQTLLDLPIAPWPSIGVPAPGLVVLYDLGDLDRAEATRLAQRREGQVLYAHASPWTWDCPVAADVTTLLYQTLRAPWAEQIAVDPDTHETSSTPADARPSEEIAAELVAGVRLAEDDLAADEPARWQTLVARTWPFAPGPRSRLYAGGPVSSGRLP